MWLLWDAYEVFHSFLFCFQHSRFHCKKQWIETKWSSLLLQCGRKEKIPRSFGHKKSEKLHMQVKTWRHTPWPPWRATINLVLKWEWKLQIAGIPRTGTGTRGIYNWYNSNILLWCLIPLLQFPHRSSIFPSLSSFENTSNYILSKIKWSLVDKEFFFLSCLSLQSNKDPLPRSHGRPLGYLHWTSAKLMLFPLVVPQRSLLGPMDTVARMHKQSHHNVVRAETDDSGVPRYSTVKLR